MSDLLFIRHAETDLAGTLCGHTDPPVNERGRAQIALLLTSISSLLTEEGESIRAIYSSDLQRAVTTAQALARIVDLQLVLRPTLREIHFGKWEGLRWTEIEARDSAHATRWVEQYPDLPAPGGEVFEDFEQRILAEVTDISTSHSHGIVAIVTHAGVMRVVMRRLRGATEQEAWERTQSYCCKFRLNSWVTS